MPATRNQKPAPANQEQQLAALVVAWLADGGWDVYQEVVTPCGRCDIVATKGSLRWAIEVKTSLSLVVLEQARRNVAYFHYSSLAVPSPAARPHHTPPAHALAHALASRLGFGVLRIATAGAVRQDVLPRLNRRPGTVALHEEQKTWCPAGSAAGGHFTRFARTVQHLARYVQHHPGTPLREAVRSIDHHYASIPSAASALAQLIRAGLVAGLRLDGGRLYPAEAITPAAS